MANEPPVYSDIFKYIDPGTEGAKATWAPVSSGTHTVTKTNEGGTFTEEVPNDTQTIDTSKIPDKYKGMVQKIYGPSGGSQGDVQFDFSKLPNMGMTKYGPLSQMTQLGSDKDAGPNLFNDATKHGGRPQDSEAAQDHSKVYWDDNYGWLTPKSNMFKPIPEKDTALDYVGKYGSMAAMMAMGMPALGGSMLGGLAASGLGAIHQGGETGDWKKAIIGAAPGLIGAGIGLSGIGGSLPSLPPELAQAIKYAQYAKTGYGIYNQVRGH
jgi:hypothetical protein